MKKWISWSFVSLSLLGFCLLLKAKAEEQKFTLPVVQPQFKPGPGSELATAQCSLCHSSDYIDIQPKFPRTVWKAEVTKMQQKYGAPIPTNVVDDLADYLTKAYGKETPAAPAKQ